MPFIRGGLLADRLAAIRGPSPAADGPLPPPGTAAYFTPAADPAVGLPGPPGGLRHDHHQGDCPGPGRPVSNRSRPGRRPFVGTRETLLEFTSALALIERHQGRTAEGRAAASRCVELLRTMGPVTLSDGVAIAWAFLPDELQEQAVGAELLADRRAALSPWPCAVVQYRLGQHAEALATAEGDSYLGVQLVRAMSPAGLQRWDEARPAFEAASRRLADAAFRDPQVIALHREASELFGDK
jgi:hypothetical protein